MSRGILFDAPIDKHRVDQLKMHEQLVKVMSGYSALDIAAVLMNMMVECHAKGCETWEEAEHMYRRFSEIGLESLRKDYSLQTGKRNPGLGMTRANPTYRNVIHP